MILTKLQLLFSKYYFHKGNQVEIINEKTLIDDVEQEEDFIQFPASYRRHFPEVPGDCILVLGNNRDNSDDSHSWLYPFLRRNQIIGRVDRVYNHCVVRAIILCHFLICDLWQGQN